MGRRFSLIAVLTLVLCFLPGCATIVTQVMGERGSRLFTGTRAHFARMADPNESTQGYWVPVAGAGMFLWAPLDFPLSLAADLAMLPYTGPAQLISGDLEFSNPRVRFLIAAATDDIALARELLEEHPELPHERDRDEPLLALAAVIGRPALARM